MGEYRLIPKVQDVKDVNLLRGTAAIAWIVVVLLSFDIPNQPKNGYYKNAAMEFSGYLI